jgi:ABC-type uncharacterized transport system permease subunit
MSTLGQKIVEEAIDEINATQVDGIHLDKMHETLLLSSGSDVDSLTLVRLLLEIERLVEESSGKSIVVVDESAFESEQSPFVTVGALIAHINRLLAE